MTQRHLRQVALEGQGSATLQSAGPRDRAAASAAQQRWDAGAGAPAVPGALACEVSWGCMAAGLLCQFILVCVSETAVPAFKSCAHALRGFTLQSPAGGACIARIGFTYTLCSSPRLWCRRLLRTPQRCSQRPSAKAVASLSLSGEHMLSDAQQ